MSKHSEAFEALLTLQRYCENRDCDQCCFCLDLHDNVGFCIFDDGLCLGDDLFASNKCDISNRVNSLELMEMEMKERAETKTDNLL